MSKSHTKLLYRDAILSTIFVFLCIALFALNPFNIKPFNIIGGSLKDIEFTDILFSGKNPGRGDYQTKISNDIVLVNSADRGRAEIAFLLNKINAENPAVVGVDFIFEGPKDKQDDSLLRSAFLNTNKLVLATKFKNDDEAERPTYLTTASVLGTYTQGYANLMVKSMDKTVRYFRTKDAMDGKTIYPFSLEVVRAFDSTKSREFIQRNRDFELINYEGNLDATHHINGSDILSGNYPDNFLKNKIVLIGFFGSDCNPNPVLDDYFYTPMNDKIFGRKFPDTYGVVIQANIIAMMLQQKYISKTPAWVDWAIGFLVCFLHNLLFIRLFVHSHLFYHFYAKLIQLGTTFLLVLACIYLFKEMHIKISASPFIVPVLLTVDLLYFYDAIVQWLHKKKITKTYFTTGPMHH